MVLGGALTGGLRAGTHLDVCARYKTPTKFGVEKSLLMTGVRETAFESNPCPFPTFSASVFSSMKWR